MEYGEFKQIVRYLEGEISAEDLNAGIKPGQSSFHSKDSGQESEIRRLRRMAFGSRDYVSSEYSGSASESACNPATSSSGAGTAESEERGLRRDSRGRISG